MTLSKQVIKTRKTLKPIFSYYNPYLDDFLGGVLTNDFIVFGAGSGIGKAITKDTVIPTPSGNRLMGDIKVGDYVFSRKGKPTKVLNVFEQGVRPVYKVSFKDGSSAFCDLDHIWKVYYPGHRGKAAGNLTVREMLQRGIYRKNYVDKNGKQQIGYKYHIDNCEPVEYSTKHYEIPPYTLGVLIGDGHINRKLTYFSNPFKDIEIKDRVEKEVSKMGYKLMLNDYSACPTYHISMGRQLKSVELNFQRKIERLNLNVKSYDKFIPKQYLEGSIKQRKALLAGLMDTDGTSSGKRSGNRQSVTSYSTSSEQLAKDVAYLVRSLGGMAKISYQDRKQRKEYTVRVSTSFNPFLLKRKADKWTKGITKKIITSIDYMCEKETVCIIIDDPEHLFLINDFIVTHNSEFAYSLAVKNALDNPDKQIHLFALEGDKYEPYYRLLYKQIADLYFKGDKFKHIDMSYRNYIINKIDVDDLEQKASAIIDSLDNLHIHYREVQFGVNELRETIEQYIKVNGIDFLILDYVDYLDLDQTGFENFQVSEIMKMLRTYNNLHEIPMFLVSHIRKINGKTLIPTEDDLMGTSNKAKQAKTVILMSADYDHANYKDGLYSTLFQVTKSRVSGGTRVIGQLQYDRKTNEYLPDYKLLRSRMSGTIVEDLPADNYPGWYKGVPY
jgi:hypothetical protein